MTTDNPRYSETERAALERRFRSALADAGLSGTLSPGSVRITEEGVSLNMSMNEARWFANQIFDLAEGSTNTVVSATQKQTSHKKNWHCCLKKCTPSQQDSNLRRCK